MRVAVPIETKSREFDGKLWLSMELVRHGHEVILGDKGEIYNDLWSIEPDLYLGKTAAGSAREDRFKKLNEAGTHVAVLDTEGGVFDSTDSFLNKRITPNVIQYCDAYFSWGTKLADKLPSAHSINQNSIYVTGNPRFDLLQKPLRRIYQGGAEEISNEYGEFILVNTNFGSVNHFSDRVYEMNRGRYEYIQNVFDLFVSALTNLVDVIDTDVVIRPHPSEDHDFYRKKFDQFDNVRVIYEGDVRNWIVASECTIHNSCTTGIESALLGKSVIAYKPIENEYLSEIPNVVSQITETPEELIHLTSKMVDEDAEITMDESQSDILEEYIANIEWYSASRIAEIISELDPKPAAVKHEEFDTVERKVKRHAKNVPGIRGLKRVNDFRSRYSKQKFPRIELKEIEDRIGDLRAVSDIDHGAISVSRYSSWDDLYVLK